MTGRDKRRERKLEIEREFKAQGIKDAQGFRMVFVSFTLKTSWWFPSSADNFLLSLSLLLSLPVICPPSSHTISLLSSHIPHPTSFTYYLPSETSPYRAV